MSARTTAKALRRRSLTLVDQLTYIPLSRFTFNIMLDVLVSQQWLFAGLRPTADYVIARTAPAVPGVAVIEDIDGIVAQRFDARPGTFYLLRPDQHVCARWRELDHAAVEAAVARATCNG